MARTWRTNGTRCRIAGSKVALVLAVGIVSSMHLFPGSGARAERNISLPFAEDFNTFDYSDLIWTVAGATHTHEPGGGWNGAGAARFTPPRTDGGMSGLGQFILNAPSLQQLNLRVLAYYSRAYAQSETRNNKVTIFVPASGTRPMMFHMDYAGWQGFAPCDGTVCHYMNPDPEMQYWPSSYDTFRVGQGNYEEQWFCLEFEAIQSSRRLNLYVTTQDGVFTGLYQTTTGDFSGFSYIDIVGGYFNNNARTIGGTEYYKFSHLAIDNSYIGPPPGFVGGANLPPTVTITAPTSSATYTTTNAAVALGGAASDSDGSVTLVSWANNRGGSGSASGTTSWSVASVPLQSGQNVITVTARDNDSATTTDAITVTYNPPVGNRAPVAVVSTTPGAVVGSGVLVTLNGASSYDPDSNPLTYAWTYVSGPGNPGLSGASQQAATFSTTVQGAYIFRLTVTDTGALSDSEDVSVTVTSPWAGAGPDREWPLGTPFTLEGTGGSLDTAHLSFLWAQISGPAATLSNPTILRPMLTPGSEGVYVLRLTTTDSTGSTSDTVAITVVAAASNVAPVASASAQAMAEPGENVVLDASASSDPNGDSLTYLWEQISGPATPLAVPTAVVTYFRATGSGTYVFRVTVSDDGGLADEETVAVVVTSGVPPSQTGEPSAVRELEIRPNRVGLADLDGVRVVGPANYAGKKVRVYGMSGGEATALELAGDATGSSCGLPNDWVPTTGVYILAVDGETARAWLVVVP